MSHLFRREALEHARRRLAGEVLLAVPLRTRVLGWLAVAVVIAGMTFASSATYSRKETVQGWLAPTGGLIRIQARQAGTANDLVADTGSFVEVGSTLVLATASVDTDGGSAADLMTQGIVNEAKADAEEVAARLFAIEADVERVRSALEINEQEMVEINHRIKLQEEQLDLAKGVVEQSRDLAERGYLPKRELDARISTSLSVEEYLGQLRSQKLAISRQMNELRTRLRQIPSDREALVAKASASKAQLGQRATDISVQGRFAVTAPIAGKVEAITVRQGQSFGAGEAVAVIAPDDDLEAELFIPARAIGFIRPGLEVRLLFDAFPYQKFGGIQGKVISVSTTSLAPTEIGDALVSLREPVYRTRVSLERSTISAYGAEIPLRSGMTVSADVIVDRRTLLEWLLDPLYAAGRRG